MEPSADPFHGNLGVNLKKTVAVSALLAAFALSVAPASGRQASADAHEVIGLLPAATAQSCSHPLIENPFAFAGDELDYVLAPDGSFEGTDGEGWLLDGGAATTAGNDPFPIRADGDDDTVLAMPSGSTAVSAPMCVDLDYPHFRLLVNQMPRENGKFRGRLRVDTMYPNAANPRWRRVDVIRATSGGWFVSDFLDLEPERGGPDPGARQVSLRFTVIGDDGSFLIDDIYVDPRFRI